MLKELETLLNHAGNVVWGPPMLVLLFGTHLFLTFRLGFIWSFADFANALFEPRRQVLTTRAERV